MTAPSLPSFYASFPPPPPLSLPPPPPPPYPSPPLGYYPPIPLLTHPNHLHLPSPNLVEKLNGSAVERGEGVEVVQEEEEKRRENRMRKKKWRQENIERNKDNDLRCRVKKRAQVLFGVEQSEAKQRWTVEEFQKRRLKRWLKQHQNREKHATSLDAAVTLMQLQQNK